MNVCFHCGSKDGTLTTIVMRASRYYLPSGIADDTDGYSVVRESKHRCVDCGRIVRGEYDRDGVFIAAPSQKEA